MDFMGSWRLQSSENFENFLRGCGVNRIMAKLALTLTPTEIISCDGDLKSGNWIIKTHTMVKSSSAHFRLNEHFKEKTIDDRIVESVFSIVEVDEESISSNGDENDSSNNKKKKKVKLVQKQIDKDGRQIEIIRSVRVVGKNPSIGDVMNVALTVGDVRSDAVFVRIA